MGTTKMKKDPETRLGAQGQGTNYSVCSFLLATVIDYHSPDDLQQEFTLSEFWRQKSESKVLAGPDGRLRPCFFLFLRLLELLGLGRDLFGLCVLVGP